MALTIDVSPMANNHKRFGDLRPGEICRFPNGNHMIFVVQVPKRDTGGEQINLGIYMHTGRQASINDDSAVVLVQARLTYEHDIPDPL